LSKENFSFFFRLPGEQLKYVIRSVGCQKEFAIFFVVFLLALYAAHRASWPCGAPTGPVVLLLALWCSYWPCGAPVIFESSVHTIYYSHLQENSTKITGNFLLNNGKQFSYDFDLLLLIHGS
jgi:hypothetical protein